MTRQPGSCILKTARVLIDLQSLETQSPGKGACDMKTVFVLLMVVLAGFGFLLSDGMHTREDLSRLEQALAQSRQENESLRASLLESERARQQLTQSLTALQEANRQLSEENAGLATQRAELQRNVKLLQMFTSAPVSLPDASSLFVVLPLIPASIAATYIIVRSHRKQIRGKDRRETFVRLSERELQELIRTRCSRG
jgi:septal ring factor EnvC (AmiA/AmiB activator)